MVRKMKPYWVNTSGNVLIKELLLLSDGTVFEDLDNLVNSRRKKLYMLMRV